MNLKDKVVIISGAKQGMGLAIAKRLKKEGAILALNDDEFSAKCKRLFVTYEKYLSKHILNKDW
jgi:NAD(P)-dependent dehydrogenase (short-subunit alcohol dehydrogenase family)